MEYSLLQNNLDTVEIGIIDDVYLLGSAELFQTWHLHTRSCHFRLQDTQL